MIGMPLVSDQIFIGTISFLAVMLCIVVLSARRNTIEPYERVNSILTPAEQHFYKVLSSALQGRALIMAKVRIADLLKVRPSVSRKNFWRHFSQISQKHIDFVVIDPQNFTTLCLIELDDKSHAQFDRIKRDKFVNRIMAQTGLPLYRIPVRCRYDLATLLNMIG